MPKQPTYLASGVGCNMLCTTLSASARPDYPDDGNQGEEPEQHRVGARLNATAPASAGSRDIPSARLIAVTSFWHPCASPTAVPSSTRMNGRAT